MSSFKRNLIIGYVLLLVLLLGSSVASYISISRLLSNTRRVEHTNLVITTLEHALSQLKDAETGQRGFLLTGDEQFLEPYNGSLDIVYDDIKNLRNLTSDNQLQQLTLIKFTDVVENRMSILQRLIDQKRDGKDPGKDELKQGKKSMDNCRLMVHQMEDREKQLLSSRTQTANQFAERTPLLIIMAAFLSIIITIISFLRISNDFARRQALQSQLIEKDKENNERINIISGIAEKISDGNYRVRVPEDYEGRLGKLAGALNKMTGALDQSFTALSQKEWLQSGLSQLNEKMLGEQTLESASENVLDQLTNYTGSDLGAFYHCENGQLQFTNGYAFYPSEDKRNLISGQGIAGQAMTSKKMIVLKNIEHSDILINYAAGEIKPREIIALPLIFEQHIKAVVVIAAMKRYSSNDIEYLQLVAENIAIVINTAETRKRLNELLQETQQQSEELSSQAEELAAQQSELETINEELENQAKQLKMSEEELRVQQEELMESNSELGERTRLLEERNRVIAEQNSDIKHKAAQLEISSKYKSEFLANMSHELRTPLNSILLLSRLLSDNPSRNLTVEQVEYAQVIQGSGHGLLSLIDEILDLSKIESGKMDVHYATASVQEIVASMRALFKPVAADKKLEFQISIDPDVPVKIETDIQRLEQILKNLLSNAFKFTASGQVGLHIKKADNDAISFSITDTGIGIAKEKQQFVFEAFRQEDGSTRRNYGGTGLGLSISRELSALMGGTLTLKSEQGKGSNFTLIVPLVKSMSLPSQPQAGIKHLPVDFSTTPSKQIAPVENKPRQFSDDRDNITAHDKIILIIEDDVPFAKALLDFTRNSGYKGIVALQGEEGLELAKHFLPMGILLDIHLPVMDGWQVIESLKSISRTRHIPVHIISSLEVKQRSLQAGAVDFSNKPLVGDGMQNVFKKIEQVISKTDRKVLIVEENTMHAKALAYYLEAHNITTGIDIDIPSAIKSLHKAEMDCVILDMGVPNEASYEILQEVRSTPGLETIPVIVFTGRSLSQPEELRIRQYADSIVVKTAHSYKRMLDEVSLFLHLMETTNSAALSDKSNMLRDVLSNKNVLLVDDDVRNIYALTKAMEQFGINVLTAIDGKDAVKQLEQYKDIQLILMDMMMPEMDGYETTRYIRTLPQYQKLPVIAVTAKAMAGDREKCIEAGASDYITKPVDTDQLISLLRVWLYDSK